MPRRKAQEEELPLASDGMMYGNLDNKMGIEFPSLLAKDYVFYVKKFNNMGDVVLEKTININVNQYIRFNKKGGGNAFDDSLKVKYGKHVYLLHDPKAK